MTLLMTLMFACSSSTELTPQSAAALADQIAASPSTAQTILSDAGTDAKAFEAYLYTVAADAELTKQYLAARKK
jgi:hypothetical protein